MANVIKNRASKLLKELLSPPFLVLLFVSFSLWFISRLSHDYTTSITVTVKLDNDFGAEKWVGEAELKVHLLARGDGRDLIFYKMGFGSDVVVPVSQLSLIPSGVSPYKYRIDRTSMELALSANQKNFRVVGVNDTMQMVEVSQIEERNIKIKSELEINCQKQYMVKGDVQLSFDSVKIKAPSIMLDTMRFVRTESLMLRDVRTPQSGYLNLEVPKGMLVNESEVRYSADVVGYVEESYDLKVVALDGELALIVPSMVNVIARVPLNADSEELSYGMKAVVGASAVDHRGVVRMVELLDVPENVMEYTITPEFVEVYSIR